MDEGTFRRRFVTLRWGRPSFIERPNGDCIFYRAEEARCSIYGVRPSQCRLFPFWTEVMRSEGSWASYAKSCPGMNDGRLYSASEIEALLREDAAQYGCCLLYTTPIPRDGATSRMPSSG